MALSVVHQCPTSVSYTRCSIGNDVTLAPLDKVWLRFLTLQANWAVTVIASSSIPACWILVVLRQRPCRLQCSLFIHNFLVFQLKTQTKWTFTDLNSCVVGFLSPTEEKRVTVTCLSWLTILLCSLSFLVLCIVPTAHNPPTCLHQILLPVCTLSFYLSAHNPPTCLHSFLLPVCTQSSCLSAHNPPTCL